MFLCPKILKDSQKIVLRLFENSLRNFTLSRRHKRYKLSLSHNFVYNLMGSTELRSPLEFMPSRLRIHSLHDFYLESFSKLMSSGLISSLFFYFQFRRFRCSPFLTGVMSSPQRQNVNIVTLNSKGCLIKSFNIHCFQPHC